MGAVSSKKIVSQKGELERRACSNQPSTSPNSNIAASFSVTCGKIMSDLPQLHTHPSLKQEKDSCLVGEREPSNLSQKQCSKMANHTSIFYNTSPAALQEHFELHRRQSSGVTHEFLESHGEERVLSCNNEIKMDSDISMQITNSNPGVHPLESNQPLVPHVIEGSSKTPKDEPADLNMRGVPDFGVKSSSICDGERTTKREMVAGTSLPIQGVNGVPALQSNEQMPSQSSQPGKVLEKLQPRRNPDAGGCTSQPDRVTIGSGLSERYYVVPKEELQPDHSESRHDRYHELASKEEKRTKTKGESVQGSILNMGGPLPEADQEIYTYSKKFEKVEKLQPRRNLDSVVQESHADAGNTPSKAPEKGLDDGYNWRKYGQKLVKGNKFVRSYYKCTYPNCQAKKQVERSHDECKSDINYLGNHYHQKPQQSSQVTTTLQVRTPEMSVASTSKTNAESAPKHVTADQHMAPRETSPQSAVRRSGDDFSGAVSSSNNDAKDVDDCPDAKRQKTDVGSADDDLVNRSNSDSGHVIQTLSEVDLVNDGYRWRKYGQKLVKGNPNPRSYYRCSNSGCPVKKHVERASHNRKLVITKYEGKHDHDIPTSRTVSQNIARGGDPNHMISPNGESSPKPEENSPVSLEVAVHVCAN